MKKFKTFRLFATIVGVLLLILFVLVVSGNINFKKGNRLEKQIKTFITSGNLISFVDVPAEVEPAGYVFLKNGRFVYYNGNFNHMFEDSNRLISYIGTWSVNGNILTLNVEEEEYAVGGTINKTPIGSSVLSDYTREVKTAKKAIKYTITNVDSPSDDTPNGALVLNKPDLKWYSLSGLDDYLKAPKALAENGYNNTYYQLVK